MLEVDLSQQVMATIRDSFWFRVEGLGIMVIMFYNVPQEYQRWKRNWSLWFRFNYASEPRARAYGYNDKYANHSNHENNDKRSLLSRLVPMSLRYCYNSSYRFYCCHQNDAWRGWS